jgi:carbon-monoxide dehydrogenase medium subunit
MPRVSYTAPTTIDDAVKALAASAGLAKVLSGGTDLLVQLKSGRARPELIVDTKRIPGMIGIREEGDKFVIGAATPGVMISADERLVKAFPGIVEGVDLIGSTQIQGRASLAGNLCNGSPAADSVPPVIAARATAVVAGPNGRREVPVRASSPARARPRCRRASWSSNSGFLNRNRASRTLICGSSRAPRWTSPSSVAPSM